MAKQHCYEVSISSSGSNEEYNNTLNFVNAQYLNALSSSYLPDGCDIIGFPKIPAPVHLNDSIAWQNVSPDGVSDDLSSWATGTYESLLGTPTYFSNNGGDPSSLSLSYNMSGGLFRFICKSVTTYPVTSNWTSLLQSSTILGNNTSSIEDLAAQGAGFFIDTDTPFGSSQIQSGQLPRHILLGSIYFAQITVADCSIVSSEIDYWVIWSPQYCANFMYFDKRTFRAQNKLDDKLTCTSMFNNWSQVGRIKGRSTPTEQFYTMKLPAIPHR